MSHPYPPGPRPRPVIGHSLAFRRDRLGFLSQLVRTYGPTATIYLGRRPVFFFSRPGAIRSILVEHADNFTNREVIASLRYLLGEVLSPVDGFSPRKLISTCCGCVQPDALLAIDGEAHHQLRRSIQPGFTQRQLALYRDTIAELTDDMLAAWRPGRQLDMAIEMRRLTLLTVAKTLFGVDLRGQEIALLEAFDYLSRAATKPLSAWDSLPIQLPFTPYRRYARAWRPVEQTVQSSIARHQDGSGSDPSLLGLVCAHSSDGAGIDSRLRDQVFLLLDAGHNTTSSALTWCIYLLSGHQDVRAKLITEIDTVCRGRVPTMDDLGRFSYLDMVIKESLRLFPPIWAQARRAVNDFKLEGFELPAGSFVFFSQWVTHRLAEYFQDPMSFRPERFDQATGERHPPYAYFPFGGGYHACIGNSYAMLEAKVVLAMILQRFTPVLLPDRPVEPQVRSMTLQPAAGMPMVLQPAERRPASQRPSGRVSTRERPSPMAFLLSSPRSGSTLLRVMLAGHPSLFSPPELNLLPFAGMRERDGAVGRCNSTQCQDDACDQREGLQRALMELDRLDARESGARVTEWVDRDLPISEVYATLRRLAAPRRLVDKSPLNAARSEWLQRAERVGDHPLYIHLVRHPSAVIGSLLPNRSDISPLGEDATLIAEAVWTITNDNLVRFLHDVPPERRLLVRFEELVRQPEAVATQVCEFLGLPFDQAVLQPYRDGRMTDGVRPGGRALGDPGFLGRHGIEPALAEAWRHVRLPYGLGMSTSTLAEHLGYELVEHPGPATVANLPIVTR